MHRDQLALNTRPDLAPIRAIVSEQGSNNAWRFEFSNITGTCTWPCSRSSKVCSSFSPRYAAAYLRFNSEPLAAEMLGPMLPRGIVFAGVLFISMAAMGLYNSRQRSRLAGLIARVAASVFGGAMFITILFYLFPALHIGRGALLISLVIAFGGSVVARIVFDTLVDEDSVQAPRAGLWVGPAGRQHCPVAPSLGPPRLRRHRLRAGRGGRGLRGAGATRSCRPRVDLLTLCEKHRVDEVVVAMDDRRRRFPMDQLLECRLEGVEILELVSFLERETGKVRLDLLNPSWMIFSEGFGRGRIHDTLERAFDIVASLLLLVVAAPHHGADGARHQNHGRPEGLHLLSPGASGAVRSPVPAAEVPEHARGRREERRAVGESRTIPRVTPIGAFTRLTRIDELPQILNVLRGEMSFVRPAAGAS